MAIVSNDQVFDDDYSAQVIAKIRELSPSLDEYVATEQYAIEAATEDVVSTQWLRNKLVCKIIEELNASGIFINIETDDICEQPLFIQTALYLRAKFDNDRLFNFLVQRTGVTEYVSEISDDPDCIGEICDYCHTILPLDEGWEFLSNVNHDYPGVIESTIVFKDSVLDPVWDRINQMADADVINASNQDVVTAYIGYLGTRKEKIAKIATTIYSTKVSTEGMVDGLTDARVKAVEGFMSRFERELGRADIVSKLDPNVKTIQLNDIRDKFIDRWSHTLDYYLLPCNREIIPTSLAMSVMVATMFVDFGGNQDARVKIIGTFESAVDALGDRYDKFREMLDEALGNLVVVSEGEVT